MTRCQAIKRDGHQCNYNARPLVLFCGVHTNYTPSYSDMTNTAIANLAISIGISYREARMIYVEQIYLENIRKHNSELDDMVESFSSIELAKDTCSICISEPEDMVKVPCCKKEFCSGCLKSWVKINRSCPACRSVLT